MPGRQAFVAGLLAAGLLLSPAAGRAQTESLSPEAGAAVDRGMADARGGDFKSAEGEFLAAWRVAPDDPRIWFDLGLADAKLPGHELRAIAWFKLYLMKAPGAPDAPAVRQQILALEAAYEAELTAVADKLEAILQLVKANPEAFPTAKDVPIAVKFERWTGYQLAAIRFALGDAKAGWQSLQRTEGGNWRQAWDADQKSERSLAGANLAESVAAAGLLDQGFDMLRRTELGDVDGFFREQGALAQARRLPAYPETEPVVHVCSPDELAQDETNFRNNVYKTNCLDELWWSKGRQGALLAAAVNGAHLSADYDDTQLLDAVQPSGSSKSNTLFDVWHLSFVISNLALQYREVRGLTGGE